MSQTVVLRKVYNIDSNSGTFVSTNNFLLTDGKGGTTWYPFISALTTVGGPIIGDLPSTISTFSSMFFSSFGEISSLWSTVYATSPGNVDQADLTSTVAGLGSSGYVSTTFMNTAIQSSLTGLGSINYISSSGLSSALNSTVIGLGSANYVSTSLLNLSLTSTSIGLGNIGYISSTSLASSITGLGSIGYISTTSLTSSLLGLGSLGYISSSQLVSTLNTLGTVGYVSTASLVSTTTAMLNRPVFFDNTGTVFVNTASTVVFNNASQVLYVSSFLYSSLALTGTFGTSFNAQISGNSNMTFSTASFSLLPFSNYIKSTSRVNLEIYPTYLFSRAASGATGPVMLPMSTFLQLNTSLVSTANVTTSFVYAVNGSNTHNGVLTGTSTLFNQTLRMEFPPNTFTAASLTSTCSLLHMIPGGVQYSSYCNAFASSNITAFYNSNAGSAFVSVQNLP
jgi:hypothetical protein